ncbi:Nucleolar Complex 2 protein, partial [Quaeritorhiza haematococci]
MGKVKKSTKKFIKNKLKDTIARRKKIQASNKKRKPSAGEGLQNVPDNSVEHDEQVEYVFGDWKFGAIWLSEGGCNVLEEGVAYLVGGSESELSIVAFSGSDSGDEFMDADLGDLGLDDDLNESGSDFSDADLDDLDVSDDSEPEDDSTSTSTKTKSKPQKSKKKTEKDVGGDEEDDEESAAAFEEHKKQLEELKKTDPEFYKYLQENDKGLLEFTDSEGEDEDGEEEKEEEEEEEEPADDEDDMSFGREVVAVTKEMVNTWKESLVNKHSLRALKKVLVAFRAATATAVGDDSKEAQNLAYKIDDSAVFSMVMMLAIEKVPVVLDHHLGGGSEERKGTITSQPKWRKLQPLAKSFATNLVRALQQMTDASMLQFVVRKSEASIPYLVAFPKAAKAYLKQLLNLWTTGDEQVRIVAFLCIRKLAITAPNPYLDTCLKASYNAFLTNAKSTTPHTYIYIRFLSNCFIELCGLHPDSTYRHAFIYIRQLAMTLRNAINLKTKESFQNVYNWQYLNCLKVWAGVLGTFCARDESVNPNVEAAEVLRPLVYPLVQVVLGAIRLKPSAQFFPYRFHCIQMLINLMEKTGTFIPVAAYLLE